MRTFRPALAGLITAGLVFGATLASAQTSPSQSQAGTTQPSQPPQATSLNGLWTLNHDLSYKGPAAGERIGPGDESGRRGGWGGGGGRGGWGGRTGGQRGTSGREGEGGQRELEMQAMEALRELMVPLQTLNITQLAGEVVFTYPDGPVRHYHTDGKTEKHQFDSGTIESRSQWKDGQLVIDYKAGQATLTQTYAINPQVDRLIITTHLEGRTSTGRARQPAQFVYDRATAPGTTN